MKISRRWLHAATAWLLFAAAPAAALTVDEARHLLVRTGFGAAPHEIRALLPLTRAQAVERLIASLDAAPPLPPPPAFLAEPITEYRERLADYLPAALAGRNDAPPVGVDEPALTHRGMQEMAQLRTWWLDRMLSTPAPFAERLALFWHGHFTSKYFDVLGPRLMHDQLQSIRAHGTRSFAALLHAMLRDPALLIFLDNAVSTRERPNENLARELLELFTLGVGHYEEADIKALARILSGHSVDFAGDWRYRVRPEELDTGPKRLFGREGAWTLDDAERLILEHPRTALLIAEKFQREFIAPEADAREAERLAAVLRAHRYELRPFLRALLRGDAFWAPANRGQLVKSPVELLVGFVRSTGLALPDLGALADDTRLLGQDLFEPPSVQGWKQGLGWLNPQSIALRTERLAALWHCREAGRDALRAEPGDLLLRFSAERLGAAPVRLAVHVDGREVARAQARCPAETLGAGQAAGKPGWDLLRVPRAQLPARPRRIEVVFERDSGQQANLFVNWIQLGGRRLPVHLAEIVWDAGESCSAQVPRGMLYCPGRARFDLDAIERRQAGAEPTLYDRRHGAVNAVIESATARQPLALRPAALTRAQLRRDSASRWQGLPLPAALLSVDALLASDHRLEALLLDPAFNLK